MSGAITTNKQSKQILDFYIAYLICAFRDSEEAKRAWRLQTPITPFEFKNRKDIYESKQKSDESKNKNDRNSFITDIIAKLSCLSTFIM